MTAGFRFAAGAMIYLVASEFVPAALERGASLERGGRPELVAPFAFGVAVMVSLAVLYLPGEL